jgi:hypothetical protein
VVSSSSNNPRLIHLKHRIPIPSSQPKTIPNPRLHSHAALRLHPAKPRLGPAHPRRHRPSLNRTQPPPWPHFKPQQQQPQPHSPLTPPPRRRRIQPQPARLRGRGPPATAARPGPAPPDDLAGGASLRHRARRRQRAHAGADPEAGGDAAGARAGVVGGPRGAAEDAAGARGRAAEGGGRAVGVASFFAVSAVLPFCLLAAGWAMANAVWSGAGEK